MKILTSTPHIDALAEQDGENSEKKSQATRLIELCSQVELFHTPEGDLFATFPVNQHDETSAIRGKSFRDWLSGQFYQTQAKAVGAQAMQDALNTLEAKARHEGQEKPVYTRVARLGDSLYIDLANNEWQAVEITAGGWKILNDPPVKFRRSRAMAPLPHPHRVACVDGVAQLRQFVNVKSEKDFQLLVGWLLSAFHPAGPYPVLALCGEQGTAKSTLARVIRALVDPNTAPLRASPRNEDDLMVSAKSGWIIALDNISKLPDWVSDALCRLATGGGLSKRELYTDDGEIILNAKRPIILTGIEEFVTRGDLQERSFIVGLPVIDQGTRRPEKEFWKTFEAAHPAILGGLFDALVGALKNEKTVHLDHLPRMADAVLWVTAAESALGWQSGSFLSAYMENQQRSNGVVLDEVAITQPIRNLAAQGWTGTCSELILELRQNALNRGHDLPSTPTKLSNLLRRLAPNLRREGIDLQFSQSSGAGSSKLVVIKKLQGAPSELNGRCVPSVECVDPMRGFSKVTLQGHPEGDKS